MKEILKRNSVFLIATAVVVLAAAATAGAQATAPLKATLSGMAAEIGAGDNILVSFEVRNTSEEPLELPASFFTPSDAEGSGLFFTVVAPDGSVLPRKCKSLDTSESEGTVPFRSGEYHGRNNYNLSWCFDTEMPGEYTIYATFTSRGGGRGTWKGAVESNAVKVQIKESPTRKINLSTRGILQAWKENYDITTTEYYKKKIAAQGPAAAPVVAAALETNDYYPFVSDLLDLLGDLRCRESGDALLAFMIKAPDREFVSNMPVGFSAGKMLAGEAAQNMQEMTGEDLKLPRRIMPDATIDELWTWWWSQNRDSFVPAQPGSDNY